MYRTTACPACGEPASSGYPALVAPFLVDYALDDPPRRTRLLLCGPCGFRYFEDRLTDAETARLYTGYRGEAYFEARHRWEPWYSRAVNDAIGGDDAVVGARRDLVEQTLGRHTALARIGTVLDFGGDRGQVIPTTVGRERFVYEISGLTPVEGVVRIGSPVELVGRTFDVVMVCHVLEHCSEPAAVLAEVGPLLGSKDALLYVELPYERPSLRWIGRSRLYTAWLAGLARSRLALMAVDAVSTAMRTRVGVVPPFGFVKLHEHVNFFDETSLRALLARGGFEPREVRRVAMRTPLGAQEVLVAVANPRASSAT